MMKDSSLKLATRYESVFAIKFRHNIMMHNHISFEDMKISK